MKVLSNMCDWAPKCLIIRPLTLQGKEGNKSEILEQSSARADLLPVAKVTLEAGERG